MNEITFGFTFELNQYILSMIFLVIFSLLHLIFKKKIDFKQYLLFFALAVYVIVNKTNGITGWDNVDTLWHLNSQNVSSGFPAFFVFKDLFDFLFFGLGFYLLPLTFGAASLYVCLVWLKQKQVNSIALIFLSWFFIQNFTYFFSFSRESVVVLFSLLFFYFLEKYYYKTNKKNLIAATLFLILACLAKVTGFLLIPFFIWIIAQKKSSNLFLIPVTGILFYLFYYTNLSSNLYIEINNLSVSFLVNSLIVLILIFPLRLLVLFKPFFKPQNFLWQASAYLFLVLFLVGLKFSFLDNTLIAENLFRYAVIFLFPFILWLSIELNLFWKKIRAKPFKAWF